MLEQPPVRYEIPDGLRLLSQSRKCIERVTAMAMAYRLSGDKRFAEGATREMLVAGGLRRLEPRHFLDTAEMTTALAIDSHLVHDTIPPPTAPRSPSDRENWPRAGNPGVRKRGLVGQRQQ